MMSRPLLEIHSSWPGTTIDGELGIVSGVLQASGEPDGSVCINLIVGATGAAPEECDYVEFVLSPEQADALAHALWTRRK